MATSQRRTPRWRPAMTTIVMAVDSRKAGDDYLVTDPASSICMVRPWSMWRFPEGLTMQVIKSVDDAQALVGSELGVSGETIDQKRINDFADVTGDHQWIHVDVERAKTQSPYRDAYCAQVPHAVPGACAERDNFRVENAKLAINYG